MRVLKPVFESMEEANLAQVLLSLAAEYVCIVILGGKQWQQDALMGKLLLARCFIIVWVVFCWKILVSLFGRDFNISDDQVHPFIVTEC